MGGVGLELLAVVAMNPSLPSPLKMRSVKETFESFDIAEDMARKAENEANMVPYEDVDTVSVKKKPWQFAEGNKAAKKSTAAKLKGKSITSEIRKRYSNNAKIKRFVDRMEELYYDGDGKQALSAGVEILNRADGKVKDSVEWGRMGSLVPDQKESMELINMFRIKEKGGREIEGMQIKRVSE